jgi:transcriptional regulator with GAF, ATPase, and Fis domain
METIPQMRARHRREIEQAVKDMAARRITQAEAAKMLGMTRSGINAIIQRKGIFWPVKQQGRKQ